RVAGKVALVTGAELGSRGLGARSILRDPRAPEDGSDSVTFVSILADEGELASLPLTPGGEIQTVYTDDSPLYARLIRRFGEKTQLWALLNRPFHRPGGPLACTPKDAFVCFMSSDLDVLTVGRCVLWKSRQDENLKFD
ncbi:MAG: carbamoyltransferase C-terminal domain-containing protein, partial [Myxococcota bacterium]